MLASEKGHTSIVQHLLNKGADINAKNKDGKTALNLAEDDILRGLLQDALQQQRGHSISAASPSIPAASPSIPAAAPSIPVASPVAGFHVIKSREVDISDRMSSTGFSSVYRGKYRGTDVVIKMLRGDGAMQISAADLQQREIEILSNLRHPRIMLDVEDRYGAMAGLVTKFMPRGSLYDVLHLNTTPPEHRLSTLSSKLRVLRDVADVMRFLHMSNVIHRDLKSPNVLLDEDGRAKVCDFGMSHATAGTPAWQAPEWFRRGGEVKLSSDVYSFGVIVWEVMTGEIPWAEYDATQIITALLVDKQTLPLPQASVNCPGEIVELMIACFGDAESRPDFSSTDFPGER